MRILRSKPVSIIPVILLIVSACAAVLAQDLKLSVVPEQVYKLRDSGKLPTESWMFFAVVDDKLRREGVRAVESKAELFASGTVVQTVVLPEAALAKMRLRTFTVAADAPVHSLRHAYARDELFDIPYIFSQVPIPWNVDKVRLTVRFALPDKTEATQSIEIPIGTYQQKTQFTFPIKGPAIITQGMWNNGGHSGYGNQFAIDLNALTGNYAAMVKDSEDLNAYATWGHEVIAPADGTVVYTRNDVADNGPNVNPEEVFPKLAEPLLATAGNAVVISHGNSEYSVMMHMQKGSVRVTKGQTIKRGDSVGLIGSSGDSFGPHLHFQVQTGPELFKHPSVPVVFENLKNVMLNRGVYFSAK